MLYKIFKSLNKHYYIKQLLEKNILQLLVDINNLASKNIRAKTNKYFYSLKELSFEYPIIAHAILFPELPFIKLAELLPFPQSSSSA